MNKQEIEENIAILKSMIPVYEMQKKTFGVNALKLAISALQQQLTNGWIPCDDRLPSEGSYYLVTIFRKQDKAYFTRVALIDKNEWYFEGGDDIYGDVIAWQPLSEPYKEDSNE